MSIVLGALRCLLGLHDERWLMTMAGLGVRCHRCGRHLLVVR